MSPTFSAHLGQFQRHHRRKQRRRRQQSVACQACVLRRVRRVEPATGHWLRTRTLRPRQRHCMSIQTYQIQPRRTLSRSSAIAAGPRNAICQLKSCQLLRSCTKSSICKGLTDLEGHSRSLLIDRPCSLNC